MKRTVLPAVFALVTSILFNIPKVEAAKIVTTVYPTQDIVIADYDVTDFGADSTGVNDATVSIQNAIDSCYSHGGGTVWMPLGTYKVSNTIYVKSFVTLRGDWADPDSSSGAYGTVISAQVDTGSSGPVLFQIGGSAGVMGLTVYYPNQNAISPVPYNYTFNIGEWTGQPGNYMAHNVINCTLLNSWLGIGQNAINDTNATEVSTFRNIKGTALYRGVVAYNSADVDTWTHINFNNSYWANAGAGYNAPALSTLNAWTRANGIGYVFGDLEWDQFYDIKCSDYNIGINIVQGVRVTFSGEFLFANIANTTIAVKADVLDSRWGVSFLRSVLTGSTAAVQNLSEGYVYLTDCSVTGSTSLWNVLISSPGTSPASYIECTNVPKVTRAVLYDVTKAPYNALYSVPQTGLPLVDAASAIQSALNDAGNQGGGVVYLPAGWYRINTHLTVPANVELRGCSSVPQLDESDLSYGTTLMGYEGDSTLTPETDTAMITLNGDVSGISGVRFFYPTNNPAIRVKPFPFTIRGNGANIYAINIGLTGVYNGLDFSTNTCDNHLVRNVSGAVYKYGISTGVSAHGWVENCLSNGAKADRCLYGVPGWIPESDIFIKVINPVTRLLERHIIVAGASGEEILNCFSYGTSIGVWMQSGTVNVFNFGTDNLGEYSIRADCGNEGTNVMNVMRYNGTTATGAVKIYNEMVLTSNLNPTLSDPVITSTPLLTGTAGIPYKYVITTNGSPPPGIAVTGNPSWLKLNGSILAGTPPYTGNFGPITVSASNSASCPNATQTFTITIATAVNEVTESREEFSVYPNPAGDQITVYGLQFTVEKATIELYNVLGEKVYSRQSTIINPQSEITVDVSSLSSGVYFLELKSATGIVVKRFVKE